MVGFNEEHFKDERNIDERQLDLDRILEACGPFKPDTYGARLRQRTSRLIRFLDMGTPISIMREEMRLVQKALNEVAEHGAHAVIE